MLKNNKGFTLYELLISFVFLVFIGYSFFNLIFDVKDKQSLVLMESEAKAFQTEIMLSIREDFTKNIIYSITSCGDTCLEFDYGSSNIKQLEADVTNNKIIYNNRGFYLPEGSEFGDTFSIIKTVTSGVATGTNDAVLHILLPVEFYDLDGTWGLDVIYQYDSRVFTFTDISKTL